MATALAWAGWFSVVLLVTVSLRLMRLRTVPAPGPEQGRSSISVVVAAHDEGPRIARCVRSILAQDHPDFELVVVDDRSSDDTEQMAKAAAEGDARVRILRVDARPEGWQGRLYAQSVGAEAATKDWLVFLSGDQYLTRDDFLRSMVAEYERRDVSAVSVFGPFVGERWWQRWWFGPVINNPIFWGPIFAIQILVPRSVWLIGAPGMRRDTYQSLGGARSAARFGAGVFDDFSWCLSISERGGRGEMVYHPALHDASNWSGFRDFWQGFSRWVTGIFTYRRGGWITAVALAAALCVILAGSLAALAALAAGRLPTLAELAIALVPPTIGLGYCAWERRNPLVSLAFYPLAGLVLVTLAGGAWARLRNRVYWRGEELRVIAPPPPEE